MPRLIRRVNNRPGEALALVLDDLQLSYDLVDGVTNPTNVGTPTDPNSPNQIRKANIFISGRSTSRDSDIPGIFCGERLRLRSACAAFHSLIAISKR